MEDFLYFSKFVVAVMLFISTSWSSFLITFLSTPFFMYIANKFGITDNPDGKLKVHKKATPYLGGVSVFLGAFFGFVVIYYCTNNFELFSKHIFKSAGIIVFFLFALLILGLIDDIKPMRPWQKFLGQFIIALFLIYFGFVFNISYFSAWINGLISVLWVVSIINAFNLVDIMDGLCSSISLFAGFNFLIITCSTILMDPFLFALNLHLMGSILAFLFYNKPDARIYLGDAGSMMLGGFFAIMSISIKWENIGSYGFCIPILILIIPIYELCALIIIRTYKKIPFYLGSPDHFAIYLQKYSWSKMKILGLVALINFCILPLVYFFQL